MFKKLSLLAISCFMIFALVGCGGEKKEEAKPAQKAEEKVLIVGTEPTFPPFEFHDEKTNEFIGFDMDLIRAIAKEMGYSVKIQNLGFDALIPSLETGNIDVAASGITITEERQKKVGFTKSYYDSGLTIVVRNDDNVVKDFDDLKGKTIAVQIGTTGAMEASRIENTTVKEFNTLNEVFLELKNGGVDAVVNDRPVNDYYLNTGGSEYAKSVGTPRNAESYGFAVEKGNTELLSKIDKALEQLRQNGEYDKIYDKWFAAKKA